MDMIEYAIYSLGRQARGIAELVPNPEETNALLIEAAEVLSKAAGARHDRPSPGAETQAAQRAQLEEVERAIEIPIHRWRGPDPHKPGPELSGLAEEEVFALLTSVFEELKTRGLIRSINRPVVGDYAETLASQALNATRPEGQDRGVDLVANGWTYQVKGRLDPAEGRATHFDIARLDGNHFQRFVGIVFDSSFKPRGSWVVDLAKLKELARPSGEKHRVRIDDIAAAEDEPGVEILEL